MTRHVHALLRVLRPRMLAIVVLSAGILPLLVTGQAAAVASGLARAVAEPAGSAQNCSSAPAGNAFYVPPNPLPPGQHGDIIWCRPVASPTPGANAWQILYLSTTVSGARTAVSGTVLVPTAPYPGTRPVTAYASGTQGWGDQCAPSREMASGSYDEQFAVDNLLSRGWAVAVTDYPGLGTPGDETYSVGIAEGHAVLDALRSATLLPGAGLSSTAPMGLEGYSQGGGAAGWAAQLQPWYAPGLRLQGIAMGGTPANLQAVAANVNGTAFFAFLGGSAIGFNAAYPSRNLLSDLTPAGRAALARLDTMCQGQALVTYAGKRIQDYTAGGINPISEPRWQKVLNANDLGAIKPQVALLQYHGLADEVIPWQVEAALHTKWCTMGVTTLFTSYPGDHAATHVQAQAQVASWLAARFAGTPAPSNC
ncbi:MAG TPA: lipase family protein [Streptosporangiaceae bacterium]